MNMADPFLYRPIISYTVELLVLSLEPEVVIKALLVLIC